MASSRIYRRENKAGSTTWVVRIYTTHPATGLPWSPSETYPSEKLANKRLHEWLAEIEQGMVQTAGKMIVTELLDEWFSLAAPADAGDTTLEDYEVSIRLHVKPYLGGLRITRVQVATLAQWYV